MSSTPGAPRAAGPLVKLNCAAIPENLLESELFGHEKGAFTGAVAQRIGRFQMADGGTIFLDEIAELTPPLQAKLLRVAQDGRFQRIGSNTEIHVNARILAATNRNLEEEVKSRPFPRRPFLPPQRGRTERASLCASAAKTSCPWPINSWPSSPRAAPASPPPSPPMSVALFLARQRPRTAQRHGARLAALPRRTHPARALARPHPAGAPAPPVSMDEAAIHHLEEIEYQAVIQTLRKQDFNRTATAKALGISRRALIYKLQRMRELGFDVDPRRRRRPGGGRILNLPTGLALWKAALARARSKTCRHFGRAG